MSLFLIETTVQNGGRNKEAIEAKLDQIERKLKEQSSFLVEVQIAKDFSHIFFIVETKDAPSTANVIGSEELDVKLVKQVRLIGESLEEVKAKKDRVNYLVEWNLPEHLTMEQYLERKKKNSVYYKEVPEVTFARTYVCEDMTKCLCFYDAPNQELVEKARKAVKAPIDAIVELKQNDG